MRDYFIADHLQWCVIIRNQIIIFFNRNDIAFLLRGRMYNSKGEVSGVGRILFSSKKCSTELILNIVTTDV